LKKFNGIQVFQANPKRMSAWYLIGKSFFTSSQIYTVTIMPSLQTEKNAAKIDSQVIGQCSDLS